MFFVGRASLGAGDLLHAFWCTGSGSTPSRASSTLATSGAVNTNDREEYGYDLNGNRTSLRKRDGRVFSFTFDALNRMTAKIVPTACVAGYACTNVPASMTRSVYYSYDARGLQTAARFDSASGADAVLNSYDGIGRLTGEYQIYGASAGTHNLYTGYGYNPAGQIVRRDRDNIAPYAYSGLVPGNRAYVADGLNRYASVGANSYGYDSNGNLTSDGGIAHTYGAGLYL